MKSTYLEKIEDLRNCVRTAGNFMLTSSRDIAVEKDSTVNYATLCDLTIEQYLEKKLPQILPGVPIFSEEKQSEWTANGLQWIIDPLDGTANFRHGFGASVISAALMDKGNIVLGMVYDAENNKFFSAVRNQGAFLNGNRLKVSTEPIQKALAFVQLGVYRKEDAQIHGAAVLRIFHECEDIRSIGSSALELSLLAAGKAELFYAPRLYPWDFAAASLIIEEAGGVIDTPAPDSLFSGRPCSVLAANSPENLEKLFEMCRALGTLRQP